MDGMLVLLGGYVILILLTAPVGFAMILGLRRRVAMLESQIAAAHGGAAATETSPRPAAAVAEPPTDSSAPIPWRAMHPSSDEPSVEAPPQAVVFTTARGAALTAWLTENWFLAVGGVSLALAGVFLVQYAVANGLLTPPLRVCAALALGTGLLLWAERMRRRLDADRGEGGHIPSTFAAGGVITLYAAVWGAFGLYGLIGPGLAFAAMAASASPSMRTEVILSPWRMASTTSMPSTTLPKTVCLPSR